MDLTPEQIAERVAWLKAEARKGADRLHAGSVPLEKRHQQTPAEELARARARADKGTP
jgi:hypothetical protein